MLSDIHTELNLDKSSDTNGTSQHHAPFPPDVLHSTCTIQLRSFAIGYKDSWIVLDLNSHLTNYHVYFNSKQSCAWNQKTHFASSVTCLHRQLSISQGPLQFATTMPSFLVWNSVELMGKWLVRIICKQFYSLIWKKITK